MIKTITLDEVAFEELVKLIKVCYSDEIRWRQDSIDNGYDSLADFYDRRIDIWKRILDACGAEKQERENERDGEENRA